MKRVGKVFYSTYKTLYILFSLCFVTRVEKGFQEGPGLSENFPSFPQKKIPKISKFPKKYSNFFINFSYEAALATFPVNQFVNHPISNESTINFLIIELG